MHSNQAEQDEARRAAPCRLLGFDFGEGLSVSTGREDACQAAEAGRNRRPGVGGPTTRDAARSALLERLWFRRSRYRTGLGCPAQAVRYTA